MKKTEFFGSISNEMSCRRRTEKISWSDRVRHKVLKRVNVETNIRHTIKRSNSNLIGHILSRNCHLKHAIEGKRERRKEVKGIQGRRSKQLLDNFEEKRRCRKLREEALDHTLRRHRFGGGYGPVVKKDKRITKVK